MATIDIRATVTCSLGELISGSVNDDYIQGGGVVKTRGSCELLGIHAPAVGTAVTFSYVAGGATKTLPRKLRVLSSFADPFRKTTKVELGCLLTYKSAVTPVPTVDGQAAITSGRQQQCLNGYAEYPADAKVPFPIRASGVMQLCLDRLGITASGNPLTNVFLRESFDLSSGYVNVISELLESEGYFGYMDEADVLQVRDLTAEGGSGPVVDGASLIDLGAIGVGDLPGEAVVVRYDSLSLDGNLDTSGSSSGQQALRQADWEKDEVVGSLQTLEVRYTSPSGGAQTATVTFTPYSETVTEYGKDQSWQDTVCIISSLRGEGADLTNSVLKRTTHERCVLGAVASNYCSELLSSGFAVDLGREGQVRTEEEYEYDQKGETTRRIRRTYEPFFKWMGGIDMTYVYATASGVEAVPAPADEVLTEEVIETYETIYGRRPPFLLSKPGEVYEPPIEAQKTTTTTYQNWALTQQGQQGAAQIKESAPFANAAEAMAWLKRVAQTLVLVDTQLQTDRTRNTAGQVRAQSALRLGGDSKKSANTEARLIYALGSASSERFATFSMPYQSDDYLTPAGVVIHSDAAGKALRYGRIQNRLLLGNRNGANLQLPPSKMPAHPFDPLYLSDGSLMVQYRANAINWAFSKDGIVSSVDALYWGVAGGSGTPWVPVAPGITTFPPLPPVVGGETSVPGLVPPWNETVPTVGITRTTAAVQDFNYVIGSLGTEDLGVVVTRTKMQYSARLSADGRVFNLAGADANWTQVRGFAAQAGAFNVTGMAADRLGFYVLKGESGALNVGFRVAELLYQRIAPLGAGAFLLDGHAAGSFNGKGMALDGTSFNLDGQNTVLHKNSVLRSDVGTFTTSGQAANFVQPDPYASLVVLLLHMNGTNNSTSFVDNSRSAKTVTANGNAKISTAQAKFGTASGLFDGNGDYLSLPDSDDFHFGSGDFTIETWYRRPSTTFINWQNIIAQQNSDLSNFSFQFAIRPQDKLLRFSWSTSGNGSTDFVGTDLNFDPAVNTWYHLAVTRNGNIFRLFVNGVQVSTKTATGTPSLFNSTASPRIGGRFTSDWLDGYLDDFRITKGVARYTANFTPPTEAFMDP